MKVQLRKDLIAKGEFPTMFVCIEGYENDTPREIGERLLSGEAFDGWTLSLDTECNILIKIDDAFYRFPNIDFEDANEDERKYLIEKVDEMEASLIDIDVANDDDIEVFSRLTKYLENS